MKTIIEKRVILGIILLFTGVALLLRFFDIIPFNIPPYVFSWKSLLILLGIVFLVTERNKTTGLILLAVGTVFLLADIMNKNLWDVLQFMIPLFLIIAGIAILWRKPGFTNKRFATSPNGDLNDVINDVSIFGGGDKMVKSQNFRGGQVTAIFGGSDIDLRGCNLGAGINGIDILCLFGGITIKVPENWAVKADVNTIFGGYSDERIKKSVENELTNPEKLLYLKGWVLFGGIEVKN